MRDEEGLCSVDVIREAPQNVFKQSMILGWNLEHFQSNAMSFGFV